MISFKKGGVIMDVLNAEQAHVAEHAGGVAVMALERVPSDIRKEGGVVRVADHANTEEDKNAVAIHETKNERKKGRIARIADPAIKEKIKNAVSIPVMAKGRIVHIREARVLEALGADFINESEVLTPADDVFHIQKSDFDVPFVCGCRDIGE